VTVAERMNRTLVELARAMLIAAQLPEFPWGPAVEHAAYTRNRSFTTSLQRTTPYQAWHDKKPDITHLRELRGTRMHSPTMTEGTPQNAT
jgi:hypothetical protein